MSQFGSINAVIMIFDEPIDSLTSPAAMLLRTLDSTKQGLGCEWGRRTLLATIDCADEPNREYLTSCLESLPELLSVGGKPEELGARARRIWYEFPRTKMQTATSKLFEGAAAMQAENTIGYSRCVQAAFLNGRDAVSDLPEIAAVILKQIVRQTNNEG